MSPDASLTPAPRIAILGSRGIPARFGGFETFVEQFAVRLVQRDCRVTVFCEREPGPAPRSYRGVRLRYVRTPSLPGLRSIWSDLMSLLACLRGYDHVLMLGYHAAFTFLLPRLLGVDLWVNMDGLEWRRAKWSAGARAYLRLSEAIAARLAPHLVADAEAIGAHLAAAYPRCADKLRVIPYGVAIPPQMPATALAQWGLAPGGYDLVVCRLEPENHVLEIIRGHGSAPGNALLAIVGDHCSGTAYVDQLRQAAGPRVRFLGTVYAAERLTALRQHCRVYLHGHSVGGTNPSLLEAMACGNRVIAHDNPFNREVLGELGRHFSDADGVSARLAELQGEAAPAAPVAAMMMRVRERYDWERITDRYLAAFRAARASRR